MNKYDNSTRTDAAYRRNVEVLDRYYNVGESEATIAAAMDITEANVRTALHGGNLASAEAHIALGLELPRASRQTALASIRFGLRMLDTIEKYEGR